MISAQSAPFRLDASCCPFPSAQRLESLFGEVFWGFISSPCILISYLTEIVSSSRNQLSQPVLAYATASLLPPCPRPPFSSFSPVIFVSRRWRRVRRGSPSSRGPRPLETFAHGLVSSAQQEVPHHHLSKSNLGNLMLANIFLFLGFMYRSCVETTLFGDPCIHVGRQIVARNEGNALKTLGRHHQKRSDPSRPLRDEESNRQGTDKEPTRPSPEHAR